MESRTIWVRLRAPSIRVDAQTRTSELVGTVPDGRNTVPLRIRLVHDPGR